MDGGSGLVPAPTSLLEVGVALGVESGLELGVALRVGCGLADTRALGVTVVLHPVSVITTIKAAVPSTRRVDLASGISAILVDGSYVVAVGGFVRGSVVGAKGFEPSTS